jgi:hypothetical protein
MTSYELVQQQAYYDVIAQVRENVYDQEDWYAVGIGWIVNDEMRTQVSENVYQSVGWNVMRQVRSQTPLSENNTAMKPQPLSLEERRLRAPQPPEYYIDALTDRVDTEPAKVISVRSLKKRIK